jgi:hypothetical protein
LLRNTLGLATTGTSLPSTAVGQQATPAAPTLRTESTVVVSVAADAENSPGFERDQFGIVGVYDGDWFERPDFSHLLDNLAASPGAFHGVRYFGALTAGQLERFLPESAGNVWPSADAPMDFSATFAVLAALTGRGLVPFVALGFFPPAVSDSLVQPPRLWDDYQALVRAFFQELAADPRFGPNAIAKWWFEAWNEPNEGRFWTGTMDDYLDLYRATSEAIAATGLTVRLGGPTIAYKPRATPPQGAPWLERFIRVVASEPDLKCDFISFHCKGTVSDEPPDPRLLYESAITVADLMLTVDPARFAGMTIINDEADEKVGFEQPYAPRLDERNAAWLGTVAAIHGGLSARYADAGFQFIGAADNANLQLVEAPFDGRRSIMTRAGTTGTDLLKLPAFVFYELLPLLGDRQGAVTAGADLVFPSTDVYHLATFASTHVGCLVTWYPRPGITQDAPQVIEYEVRGIPWPRVNVARFQVDATLSNAHTAAGGSADNPYPLPDPAKLGAIRQAQELAVARPIERNLIVVDGLYRESLELAPYTTILLWLTPVEATTPAPPAWRSVTRQDGNVVLQWLPNEQPGFYSYEVFLMQGGVPGDRLTPMPLRSALWVDTSPPSGPRSYGVRTVTASGVTSPIAGSEEVTVD